MSINRINMDLYNILKKTSNVTDDEAREASTLDDGIYDRLDKIEKDMHLLKWMVGTNTALNLGILFRLLMS